MYQASKKFGDAIAGSNRKFNTRLLENEKVLVESVKNFTITSGAEEITIGSAVASYVQATIENKGIALSGKEVSLEIGVEVDGAMEYIPMGLYTIQNPKIESNKVTFTAYDRLASKCNGAYYSKLGYPVDAVDILAEISTMTGVAIDTSTLQRGIQINQRAIIEESDYDEETEESEVITTYVNPFDGYTYKETIGFIAGLFGKFAVCGRTGMIEFRWYRDISYEIQSNIFYNDLQETEESFSIERLTCDNSDQTLSSGSGATGISMQNPVMTQSILDGVCNAVQGLVFTPAALRFIGDMRLDIGDIATAVKNDSTKFTIPIISLTTSYDGGLMQTIASYGNTAEEDDSDTKGPITEMAERVEYELAFVKKLMVDNLTATNATIKNLSGDVLKFKTGEFETLKTDVANFKQTFTDDLQASNAKINTLESDNATFKEATATNFNATNARIANIEADYLKATDAKLTYATITNLNTTNAEITKLKTKDAEIDKLVATKATITGLNAAVGRVGVLESSYANLNTLVNGNLTSDNIQNLTLTSKNTTIENGMIKNAMIENLSFDKITGMDINTTNLTVHSSDGKSKWSDNTIQISDANRVRVQIGKDASNDYSMSVWDKNGNLIWDALGATEKTIQRKIIRDGIVADDANISGSKLDINSVIKEVNGSTTKLKSSTIVMNDKNQTLDVVFNEMETTVADNLSSAKLYADGKLSDAQKYALEQANSALSSAKSYADSAVDNIEVGGRNLLVQKNITQGYLSTDGKGSFIGSGGGDQTSDWIDVSGNKYITITLYEDFTNTNNSGRYCEYDADKNCINTIGYNPRQKSSVIIELKSNTKYIRVTAIECKTRRYKIEKGNKATDWTPAPEDTQSQIDNVTEITTSHTTSISTMQGQISSLISEDTTIKGNYDALLSRYNATVNTVDSMKTTIGEHTTILNSQNDSIVAVTTKANTIESNLAGTTQTVSEVKSNLSGTQQRVTKVETSLSGLTTRVSSTETNLANLEIGGRNLVLDSKPQKQGSSYAVVSRHLSVDLQAGVTYTISFCGRVVDGDGSLVVYLYRNDWKDSIQKSTKSKENTVISWQFTPKISGAFQIEAYSFLSQGVAGGNVYLDWFKVEKGNKATDWTPAPEDVDQQITAAETIASQTADKFNWLVKSGTNSTDFELTDRTATLVASAINMNGLVTFSGLNTDAKNEIEKTAQSKVDCLGIGGRNLALNTSNSYSTAFTSFNGVENTCFDLGQVTCKGIAIGDVVTVHLYIKYTDIVPASGQTARIWLQGPGNITVWNDGNFAPSEHKAISGSGEFEFLYSFTMSSNMYINTYWTCALRTDYIKSGSIQYKAFKVEKGNKATDWTPAPEDYLPQARLVSNWTTNTTWIDGGKIYTGSITADKIATDAIKSRNYISSGGTQGSFLNLSDGSFQSPNLSWDSNGNLIATGGLIAGWTITNGKLYNGTSAGYAGIGKESVAWAFWAGASSPDDSANAPFRVGHNGSFKATNADITGIITATSGKIGRYDITKTYLMTNSGSNASGIGGNQAFWAGAEDSNSAPFRVGYDGRLIAENAVIKGNIEAGNLGDEGDTVAIMNGHIGIQGTSNNVEIYSTGFKFGIDGDYYLMSVSEGVKCYRNLYATDFVADGWLYCSEVHSSGAVVIASDSESFYWAHGYQIARGTSWGGVCVGDDSQQLRLYGSSIWAAHGISTSDENLKENFTTLDQYEDFYMNLNPIGFNYIGDYDGKKTHFGFGAHKTEDILESEGYDSDKFAVVTHRPLVQEDIEKRFGKDIDVDIETEYGVSYTEFIALNTHMIQKTRKDLLYQSGKIDIHEAIINDLQFKIAKMEKKIEQLTKALA